MNHAIFPISEKRLINHLKDVVSKIYAEGECSLRRNRTLMTLITMINADSSALICVYLRYQRACPPPNPELIVRFVVYALACPYKRVKRTQRTWFDAHKANLVEQVSE